MKNLNVFLFVLSFLIAPISAYTADVVVNPTLEQATREGNTTLYQQYMESLKQTAKMAEEIAQMKEMVLNTAAMKEQLGEMIQKAKVAYNNTFGLIGNLKKVYDELAETPEDIEKFMAEFKEMIDCAIDDVGSYGKAEMVYNARYVYRGKDNATPLVEWDDMWIGERYSSGVDSFEALNQDPCGFNISTYARLKRKNDHEAGVLKQAIARNIKTEEEIRQSKERFDAIAAKVKSSTEEKETLDMQKQLLFYIWQELIKLNGSVNNLVILDYAIENEKTRSQMDSAKFISKEQYEKDKAAGIEYNGMTHQAKFMKDIKMFIKSNPPQGTNPL